MAKYTKEFTGDFEQFVNYMHKSILEGSMSATFEDRSDYTIGETRLSFLVYERYSYLGNNRVSLSVLVSGNNNNITIDAITSGGSQAMFVKFNTFGEESFLLKLSDAVRNFIKYEQRDID